MKALLLTEYGRLAVTDMDVLHVGAADVLVRVCAFGICGSDIHGYTGTTARSIPPLVMGPEAVGVIERVGPDVTDFAAGDCVTLLS
jgi:L-iditol 2-dehydrogenase